MNLMKHWINNATNFVFKGILGDINLWLNKLSLTLKKSEVKSKVLIN